MKSKKINLRKIGITISLSLLAVPVLLIVAGYGHTGYKELLHPLATPSQLKSMQTKDGNITYLSYGDHNADPVVFLHGTGANSFIWEKTSLFLADHGYYVIAVDIPPFGWSSIPKDQDYRKEVQAKRIISLLSGLSITKPIIVGHSFNSKVALQIASMYDIKKLILVAPVLDYENKNNSSIVGTASRISILRDPLLSLFVNNTGI